MASWKPHFWAKQFAAPALLAAACLALHRLVCRAVRPPGATCKTVSGGGSCEVVPYQPDRFPGARSVETLYGTIKVFEWGPEDGDKVLLVHGMATPSVALGDMAWELVRKGCRVMLFDLFGRGYSDAPLDLPCDERLYTTQILLVLASSPLPWTGTAAFHILGYSLGGALVTAFAAYHSSMLRSVTGVCPAGLMHAWDLGFEHELSLRLRGWVPGWLLEALLRRKLEPLTKDEEPSPTGKGPTPRVLWDEVPCSVESASPRVGDVIKWQLRTNKAYVHAYMSTYQHTPVWDQRDGCWRILSENMARNRRRGEGLRRMCIVLGDDDALLPRDRSVRDATAVLGEDGVDITVLEGTHSLALTRGAEIARIVMRSWQEGENMK